MTQPDLSSFTHVVAADRIAPGDPVTVLLTMSEQDREALAKSWNMPGIEALSGEALAARRGGVVEVEGRVRARLVRQCVASLEEMNEEIDETFLATFTDRVETRTEGEFEADLDAPEPMEDGRLDLGSVLLEQLVLAIDPHPRRPDAEPVEDPGAGARITPFDVLKTMQKGS